MEQISLHIQKFDMKELERCFMTQGKKLVKPLNLRRMISGARLFNYCKHASQLSPLEFAEKVIEGELHDPVLSFDVAMDLNSKKCCQTILKMYVH